MRGLKHGHICNHAHLPPHTEEFINISESKRLFIALRVNYTLSSKPYGRRVLRVQQDVSYGDFGSPHMFRQSLASRYSGLVLILGHVGFVVDKVNYFGFPCQFSPHS
jgi:hypothetical protein